MREGPGAGTDLLPTPDGPLALVILAGIDAAA